MEWISVPSTLSITSMEKVLYNTFSLSPGVLLYLYRLHRHTIVWIQTKYLNLVSRDKVCILWLMLNTLTPTHCYRLIHTQFHALHTHTTQASITFPNPSLHSTKSSLNLLLSNGLHPHIWLLRVRVIHWYITNATGSSAAIRHTSQNEGHWTSKT